MISPSEMYQVFESPYPTLITHTSTGLGVFVSHPKIALAMQSIGVKQDLFQVSAEGLTFSFPMKVNARQLFEKHGGIIAFTDETGMPWYTLEMPPTNIPIKTQAHKPPMSRSSFGRREVINTPVSAFGNQKDEGEFSL